MVVPGPETAACLLAHDTRPDTAVQAPHDWLAVGFTGHFHRATQTVTFIRQKA
jgi:hypothetical protein